MDLSFQDTLTLVIFGLIIFSTGIYARKLESTLHHLIETQYPKEWERVNKDQTALRGRAVKAVLISESLRDGYLSEQSLCKRLRRLQLRAKILRLINALSAIVLLLLFVQQNL